MDTTEDTLIVLTPCRLFDACLCALSLAAAKVRTESSLTCSFLIKGGNRVSNTVISDVPKQKVSGDGVDDAARFDSSNSPVNTLLRRRAY